MRLKKSIVRFAKAIIHWSVDRYHLQKPYCSYMDKKQPTDRTLTVPRTHNRFGDRSFAVAAWASFMEQFADKSAADL